MLLVCSSHPAFFPISVTQEVYVALPPMYHCYGLVLIMLLGLYRGAKIVTMTGFTVQSYLQATQSHKVWNIFAGFIQNRLSVLIHFSIHDMLLSLGLKIHVQLSVCLL